MGAPAGRGDQGCPDMVYLNKHCIRGCQRSARRKRRRRRGLFRRVRREKKKGIGLFRSDALVCPGGALDCWGTFAAAWVWGAKNAEPVPGAGKEKKRGGFRAFLRGKERKMGRRKRERGRVRKFRRRKAVPDLEEEYSNFEGAGDASVLFCPRRLCYKCGVKRFQSLKAQMPSGPGRFWISPQEVPAGVSKAREGSEKGKKRILKLSTISARDASREPLIGE